MLKLDKWPTILIKEVFVYAFITDKSQLPDYEIPNLYSEYIFAVTCAGRFWQYLNL